MLRITLKKSTVGHNWRNRQTIQALGIHKVRQTVEHEDTPNIRGMIHPVRDLLIVEEVEGTPAPRLDIAKKVKASRARANDLSENGEDQ
ncbi:MAG: 50S ribosomal protein L30 [Armatimonadota bacterium]